MFRPSRVNAGYPKKSAVELEVEGRIKFGACAIAQYEYNYYNEL